MFLIFKYMYAIDVMVYWWCLSILAILLFFKIKMLIIVVLLVELAKVNTTFSNFDLTKIHKTL